MTTAERDGPRSVVALVRAHDLAVTEAERTAAETALDAHHVHRMVVERGDPVDPSRHHVVDIGSPGPEHSPGTVIDVVRPGWCGPQGVIRPSEVRVAAEATP